MKMKNGKQKTQMEKCEMSNVDTKTKYMCGWMILFESEKTRDV